MVCCTFVDLQKAYDSVPRTHLFATLWGELGVSQSTIKCLHHMYMDIRASVLIGSVYSRPFDMLDGVC